MTLDNCVSQIICGLSAATLRLLDNLLLAQKTALLVEISAIEAQILELDVLVAPLRIAGAAAQAALSTARQVTTLIPLQLAGGCLQISDVGATIRTGVDIISADLRNIEEDLARALSFRDELEALKQELEADLELLNTLRLQIQVCAQAAA